jgi:protein-S-isoprenylcysteine O-methyltransferase Ste14
MADLAYRFAVTASSATAAAFVIAMFAFFRPRPGAVGMRAFLVCSVVAGVGSLAVPVARAAEPPGLVFGATLLAGAHWLFWWAAWSHGRCRPSGAFAAAPPPKLVVDGAYRVLRHPFYVAYLLAFAAGAAFAGVWWAWAVPTWMLVVYRSAARHEEAVMLASPLGNEYRRYRQQVGGFLPRPCQPPGRNRSSFRRAEPNEPTDV